MPDFLTRRDGTWHFVRRVPKEFAEFDPRTVIRHSTKIKVADDRTGRKATRVADKLNAELEAYWLRIAAGKAEAVANGYEDARRRARSLGFDYVESGQLLMLPPEARLDRVIALDKPELRNDAAARAAVLGTQPRPSFQLSKLFEEYDGLVKDETKKFSPNQFRIWRNSRVRVVKELVDVVGDKPVTDIAHNDGLDYVDWLRDRVTAGEAQAGSANKAIGMLSRMLKDISVRRRLNLPEIFKGLRLRNDESNVRSPFETGFIQSRLLAAGALDGLNEDARLVLYVLADTGLRPSEVVNLQPNAIHLDAPIPYVEVLPDGRVLKTGDSHREVPLVGVAFAAMKLRPEGFPRYRDKSSSLSAAVNKYLLENDLRPTKLHTVYSLRHSFKDRLVAAEAPDSLIDNLMGHRTGKPKYGKGPSLELKRKFLNAIAFKPPPGL